MENLKEAQIMFRKFSLLSMVCLIVLLAPQMSVFASSTLNFINPRPENPVAETYGPPWFRDSGSNWLFIYDTLIGNDEQMKPVEPNLATSWEISEDGLTWVFHLREDVKFHDGVPFTAIDVKTTIEKQTHPDLVGNYVAYVNPFRTLQGFEEYRNGKAQEIEGIKVVDDHTVQFNFVEPSGTFLLGLGISSILPHHKIKDIDPTELFGNEYFKHPIGTGPFEIKEIVEGDYYLFSAYEDYHRGRPKIDEIVVRNLDPLLAVANKQVDFYVTYTLDIIEEAEKSEYELNVATDPMRFQYFRINQQRAPFDDINFRKALIHAIDREAIIDTFYGGYARITTGLMGPGYWHNDELEPLEYDVNKARSLVKESSYDGREFDLIYYYPDELSRDLVATIQYFWKEAGINAKLRLVDGATATAIVYGDRKDEFTIVYAARAYEDPSWLADYTTGHSSNYSGYSSKQYDELIDKAQKTIDLEERRKYYHMAQALLYEAMVDISLWAPDMVNIMHPRLHKTIDAIPGFWYPVDLGIHEWEIY